MIGVPNMDMPHDWLLALESEIEVLTNQNQPRNSERMIFSTDDS